MTIHERIKARRKECNLSADEVASKLGVSRATIYRYESAEIINMGIDKVAPLAKVLHTTPEYLMGWTNDPIDYSDPDLLNEAPVALLHEWQKQGLSEEDQAKKWTDFQKAEYDSAMEDNIASILSEFSIQNPDIRMIARAGKKMTPEQAKDLRKFAEYMYPEAFTDDE